jgi:ParB family chromosome partitioning protein
MNKKVSRNALGRGLSNLIPVKIEQSNENSEIHSVSISSIKMNPFQPRIDFNEEEIHGLAESINNQGLLQPIVVRQKGDVFEIISGERRFRAFQYLCKDSVPCIIKQNVSDREMIELALIENIQREELNEIEKARAYQKLLLEYNYTHEQLSEHIGKTRTVITNALRLLNLPEEIQVMVRKNQISMGHARALLSLKDEDQLFIAKKIIDEQLSVRDVENLPLAPNKLVKKLQKITKKNNLIDPDFVELLDRLQHKFGTSVSIKSIYKNKGSVTFRFFDQDDLTRLVDLLLK